MLSKAIIKKIEEFAKPKFAESWDNVGLQLGSNETDVKKILLALDLSRNVCKKAVNKKFDMIITHHPFVFSSMKSICLDGYRGELIRDLIKNDIVVYSAHTNLDICNGGVNDTLCELLEVKNTRPIAVSEERKLCKISVFSPRDYSYAEKIRNAIGEAGYGKIGNYSNCSFSSEGIGRFKPEEGSSPFIGSENSVESVNEEKIEFIVYEDEVNEAIRTVKRVHPYEEVAYDIFSLNNRGQFYGHGRYGNLEQKTDLESFAKKVRDILGCESVRVYGHLNTGIKSVAVCGGSGSSFIKDAKFKRADVYVTGDIKHHDAQIGREMGICLIDAGHYFTEVPVLKTLKDYLDENLGDQDVEIEIIEDNISKYTNI